MNSNPETKIEQKELSMSLNRTSGTVNVAEIQHITSKTSRMRNFIDESAYHLIVYQRRLLCFLFVFVYSCVYYKISTVCQFQSCLSSSPEFTCDLTAGFANDLGLFIVCSFWTNPQEFGQDICIQKLFGQSYIFIIRSVGLWYVRNKVFNWHSQ